MASEDTDITTDSLYHVLVEIIDYKKDPSGATRIVDVFNTYATLPVAKENARTCLKKLGYDPGEFAEYEEKAQPETWRHGDGVLAYAKAPAGQVFEVRVETTPNLKRMKAHKDGVVDAKLYYVLQMIIDYNTDRVGSKVTTVVEGVYGLRNEAVEAAYTVLLDEDKNITPQSYAEYDERDKQRDDWPWGDEVCVHAVSQNGENYLVVLKEQMKWRALEQFS